MMDGQTINREDTIRKMENLLSNIYPDGCPYDSDLADDIQILEDMFLLGQADGYARGRAHAIGFATREAI